jgi:hypothetical protein
MKIAFPTIQTCTFGTPFGWCDIPLDICPCRYDESSYNDHKYRSFLVVLSLTVVNCQDRSCAILPVPLIWPRSIKLLCASIGYAQLRSSFGVLYCHFYITLPILSRGNWKILFGAEKLRCLVSAGVPLPGFPLFADRLNMCGKGRITKTGTYIFKQKYYIMSSNYFD